MPETAHRPSARVASQVDGDQLTVRLGGVWQITENPPRWEAAHGSAQPRRVRLVADGLERWDTSLLLFLFDAEAWCRRHGATFDPSELPPQAGALLAQLSRARVATAPADRAEGLLGAVGRSTLGVGREVRTISHFVGETVLAATRLAQRPQRFRWRDCLAEMQQCGAMGLPIVSLISFLVGVTLAYTGAIVLRQYGGDIYIADLIGLSMVRETGAVMTAVVLAGRTGAAFAATIGNMKANEEVDALETLGIAPVQFLVLPRLVALAVMTPLLSIYANALGMIGGMVVALGILQIQPSAYWTEMQTSIDLSDMWVGVIKALAFGVIIGLSGCLRGLQAERSAAGVGRAATSAVVTAILLLVVADALFAVVFNILGW